MEEIGRDQHGTALARVLPPMRSRVRLGGDIAGMMDDRDRASAGIFGHLARDDIDHRRPVAVAVPRDDAASLDDEPAQAELAVLDRGRLLRELDRAEDRVDDTLWRSRA